MGVCDEFMQKIKNSDVPTSQNKVLYIILGIINLIFFGIGMIIIGIIEGNCANILIGLLQLILPLIGWIWAVVWGVLIITRNL